MQHTHTRAYYKKYKSNYAKFPYVKFYLILGSTQILRIYNLEIFHKKYYLYYFENVSTSNQEKDNFKAENIQFRYIHSNPSIAEILQCICKAFIYFPTQQIITRKQYLQTKRVWHK